MADKRGVRPEPGDSTGRRGGGDPKSGHRRDTLGSGNCVPGMGDKDRCEQTGRPCKITYEKPDGNEFLQKRSPQLLENSRMGHQKSLYKTNRARKIKAIISSRKESVRKKQS